jgi:hypothetical protein
MESHNYSYMQFRTNSGGFETGSVKSDVQGKNYCVQLLAIRRTGARFRLDAFQHRQLPRQQLSGRLLR